MGYINAYCSSLLQGAGDKDMSVGHKVSALTSLGHRQRGRKTLEATVCAALCSRCWLMAADSDVGADVAVVLTME